ncbi:MAG: tetraacyldisaccharide 4'-kinase [Thermodesulfobacteriota bacterium]
MNRLKRKVGRIIEGEAEPDAALAALLSAAAGIYGGGVRLRGACYDRGLLRVRRLPCPVVSIGNIAAGGTGKTPMAMYVARTLQEMGYRPAVLSRGYKGGAEKDGAVVSNGRHLLCGPSVAGDEAFMMAAQLPGIAVLVGGNRYQSARRGVAELNADVIILDDGFQHRRLYRDIDLVLLDARQPLGNQYLLPRGILREPVTALERSHALVLTRSREQQPAPGALQRRYPDKPIFCSDHCPYVAGIFDGSAPLPETVSHSRHRQDLAPVKKSRVYVFSGIARNREFADMLEKQGVDVAGRQAFSDHHRYSENELEAIVSAAESRSAQMIVTTEKDYVRIAGRLPGRLPVAVVGVRIIFHKEDASALLQWMQDGLTRKTDTETHGRGVCGRI